MTFRRWIKGLMRVAGPTFVLACGATGSASAGDMAQIDLLGFSHDKSHFAFED